MEKISQSDRKIFFLGVVGVMGKNVFQFLLFGQQDN